MKSSLQAYEEECKSQFGDSAAASGATKFLWDLIEEVLDKFDEDE